MNYDESLTFILKLIFDCIRDPQFLASTSAGEDVSCLGSDWDCRKLQFMRREITKEN